MIREINGRVSGSRCGNRPFNTCRVRFQDRVPTYIIHETVEMPSIVCENCGRDFGPNTVWHRGGLALTDVVTSL